MAQFKLLEELKDSELTVLIYLVFHTLGPSAALSWSDIRNGVKDKPNLKRRIGLDYSRINYDYEENTFNVRFTRTLDALVSKGYVLKIKDKQTPRRGSAALYAVTDETVRKTVHNYFKEPDVFLYVKGIIPIPGFKVKDFLEFREYVIDHGLFNDTLQRAYKEYQELWEKAHRQEPNSEIKV